MRLLRVWFTVRHIMIAVAVVAVNFGLIRGANQLPKSHWPHNDCLLLFVAQTFLPSLSLLTVAAMDVGVGLVKSGQAPSFSTGYLLLGGLVSFGLCLDLATQCFILDAVVTTICRHVNSGPVTSSMLNEWLADALQIIVSALPQVTLGLIGGGLAKRYGLMIVRSGRAHPEGISTSATAEA